MRTILTAVLTGAIALGAAAAGQAKEVLSGAGASFPYPIYSKWFSEYGKVNTGVEINYQSIGSGGGIRQITARTVDFGATDGPMDDKALFKVDGKILHIPTVLGAVVPIFNLKGVNELNLTGEVLADIFLGKIKSWDDAAIGRLNPDVEIPSLPITVVHRADGSGTSFCFTDYLSKVSPAWKSRVGCGNSVKWPCGLGGKGNEGVAGLVKQTPNAIGYVELIYAKQNSLSYAAVRNRAGKFVKGSEEGVTAAAAGAAKTMPADYRVSIVDAPGENTYPISTYTWLLVYEKNAGGKGTLLKGFLRWMLEDGQKIAPELGYAPLPENVRDMVAKTVSRIE
ncbi:MAG: phosphate ABC transporter substrate-binding protein PstS [Planctomycetota bacterium]